MSRREPVADAERPRAAADRAGPPMSHRRRAEHRATRSATPAPAHATGAAPPGSMPPGPPAPWPAPPGGGEGEPRQRLHPLSPVLHGAKSLVVVIAGLSWSTLSRVGFGWFAAMVAVLALGATVLSVVSWYNTGYHVVGRELRVYEGLLWRRTRAIPLERLQAVEVVRPLLAQLTGLAELRLEVVGGGKTEAPLAYLGVADAARLRERLLALAGRVAQAARARRRGAAVLPGAAAPTGGRAGPATARGTQPEPADQPTAHPAGVPAPVRCGLRRGAVPHRGVVVVRRGGEHADRDGRRAAATGPPGPRRLELPAGPRRRHAAGAQRPAGDAGADRAAGAGADRTGHLAAALADEGLAAAAAGGGRLLRRGGRRPQPARPAAAGR